MNKTQNSVRGHKIYCVNFQSCPICYGCRNFNSSDEECLICAKDKHNLCRDLKKHNTKIVSKFITRSRIKFDENISFK